MAATQHSAMESALVVASNRGPVRFERGDDGKLVAHRGSGGLVTVLGGVLERDDATWVAAAVTEGDREVSPRGRKVEGAAQRVRYVDIPEEQYDGYYNGIANGILWFAHHYLWDIARTPTFDERTEHDWADYIEANRAFARALAVEAKHDPVFLIQDYHLTLVPQMLRDLAPEARILHFSHTPFAGRTYLRTLPVGMRQKILRGMLGADVVGFQGRQWGENFLLSARELEDVHVDIRAHRAEIDGREVQVRAFPVAVGAQEIREAAATDRAKRLRTQVEKIRGGRKLLLRVDRLEPSKNILRGFLAFELFLQRHPEWRDRVVFLALLSPSREEVPAYRDYGADCRATADRINATYGKEDWTPIVVKVQEDFTYAVAAYDRYDAMLVNPVHDGMNLVAMEGPVVNTSGGVLILSRNAGAFGRLGRHSLAINPFDLSESADAIYEALAMPDEERTRRARGLQRSALSHTPATWLAGQLRAIDEVRLPSP
ncbi:MAG: trehalose-6-phosphate synthase [Actinomycetota bacterium]